MQLMLDSVQPFQQLQQSLIEKLLHHGQQHGPTPQQNLSITIAPLPLLALLKGQAKQLEQDSCLLPTIYWQDKQQNLTLASFGSIETRHSIPDIKDDAFYLGGLAFQQQGEQWQDFPATQFICPAVTLQVTTKGAQAIFQFNGKHNIQTSIDIINSLQPPTALSEFNAQQVKRQDSPTKSEWAKLVELAIEYKALLPKVVLSRQTQICFDQAINAWDIMGLWQQANPNSYHYVFQFSAQQTFVSCSPESLYTRQERHLKTEALAGTVNRGRDQREDSLLLQSLLNDKKIDRENYLVQEFIIANLKQLKANVTCAAAHVMQLQHVQHLCVPIEAQLATQTKDSELLYKLHPTPAVAGSPKLPALQFVNDNEPYTRGWYAGAVGYISRQQSDFSVAIRSALISQNCIKLFAGAGIVTGSIAEQEWQELENKIQTILTILHAQ